MAIPERFNVGQIVKQVEISGNRSFTVVISDLLGEPVEAIVNPANGGLSHGGGLAAQIAAAAGDALDRDGRAYLAKHGWIRTGEAAVTTAGKLPFKGVIHAVGPAMGTGNETELLVEAVYHSLRRAHERGWGSLSFPAISSGIFSVPKEICARSYVLGVIRFLQEFPDSPLKVIRLCLFQSPLLDCVLQEIDQRATIFQEL